MKLKTIITLLLVILSGQAHSENNVLSVSVGLDAFLATMDTFYIEVVDEVTGGCLPRPNDLKNKMEIGLRRNGFKISKEQSHLGDFRKTSYHAGRPDQDIPFRQL